MRKQDYTRRNFIKKSSLTGLGVMTVGSTMGTLGCSRKKTGSRDAKALNENVSTITGMNLEQLRDRYKAELFDNFIPNMDKYAIDHEYGGVMCSLDVRSGELANKNKTAWFVGRGMWVYSFMYNNIEKNPRYLEIARKSKDLLLKLQPTDDSFWAQQFTYDGKPLTGPGDIYGSLFVAEGLAQYAEASGEKQYRGLAKKIIFDCVERYDRPDYNYNIGSYFRDAPQIKGTRVLGHWMIFLSLCTQMLKLEPDADLEGLAARSVDAILNYHVNKDYGLTNEILNHDLSLPDNEFSKFSIVGHGLETITFVMFEAARLKDANLFRAAEPIFKKHVDVAADALYGGYFSTLRNVDKYTWGLGKSLWCQQEVLNGALFLVEHTGDEWGKRHFARTDSYIYEKFFNSTNKFWHSGGDRKMINPNVTLLEHYHHARQLMYGLLSIERMISRGGKISGLFA